MQKEKVRIFALARELDMESKDLLTLCRQNGIDVKNQLSTIEPEVRDQIVQLVRRKSAGPSGSTSAPPRSVTTGVLDRKVAVLDTPRRPPQQRTPPPEVKPPAAASGPSAVEPAAAAAPTAPTPPPAATAVPPPAQRPSPPAEGRDGGEAAVEPPAPRAPEAPPVVPASKTPEVSTPPPSRSGADKVSAAPERPQEQPPARTPPTPPRPVTQAPGTPTPVAHAPGSPAAPSAPAATPPPAAAPPTTPAAPRPGPTPSRPGPVAPTGGAVPNLSGGGRPADRPPRRPTPQPTFRGAVPPKPLKDISKPKETKPKEPTGPRKIAEIPAELLNTGGPITIRDVISGVQRQQTGRGGGGGVTAPPPDAEMDDEMEGEEGKGKGPRRIGVGVVGREARHKVRAERQAKRKSGETPELKTVRGIGGVAVVDEEERHRSRRHEKLRKLKPKGPQPRKGKVPIQLPITVRSLSEAIGVRVNDLITKLMNAGMMATINSTIEPDVAETLALDHGVELDVKRQLDAEDKVLAEQQKPDRPEDLVPRAPVVTIMGHVDHGKTSLLDRIRTMYGLKSDVVSTEAGGITQVLRAWRVEKDGKPITFLDTPGHEAFTKMRARGANVTDIAVIVVAADDGVMPQTEEAISHAKAAEVKMVVAINKVDLPNANLNKTRQQLYSLNVLPDNMGGDTPFIETSAATGKGIDELLEQISVVAELEDLKANPNKPASGTCLEAYLSEEEGVLATLLVQEGTLRQGDVVVCGASYGRVRAMYNDLGRPIDEAGPSVPVRITGLDVVPNADDTFLVVPDLAMAREVAEKRKDRAQEAALVGRKPLALEDLTAAKIAELKVILKAEARGSIEAIRKELEKLHHEEVRVRVLHAAIGGITESDVQLALTSPQDTLILGFNVVPDDRAHALAEERGVSIRQYNIIYQLTDDVRSALEGKLKPREEVIHLGRAVVRETFKISRVGTIAGCYVTQGVIERNARVRVIRQGVVVYPPPERSVGLESLKRFKEDVREVREGFECGLKIAGYDDVKVDDVIEAYRVEQVQRTLS